MVVSIPSFIQSQTTPAGWEWKRIGYLDMTNATQRCPDSWQSITLPIPSCGRKSTNASCNSLIIPTSEASYKTVCGKFRGYQIGSPDGFNSGPSIESYYVDGISITYGPPGNRRHVYSYAASAFESPYGTTCLCAGGGNPVPWFVGSDYYCESGNPTQQWTLQFYSSDVLWDRQQCRGYEGTCCNPLDLPWFCKTFPNTIHENLEVRLCMDEIATNEDVAIESFELYLLQGEICA